MSLSQVSSTSKKVKFKSWIWFIAALSLSERAWLLLPNWGWGVLFLGFQGEWEARAHGEGKGEGPALGGQLLAEFQELKYQSKITCTHTSYSWWSYWWWSRLPKLVWPSWFQLFWTTSLAVWYGMVNKYCVMSDSSNTVVLSYHTHRKKRRKKIAKNV